MHDVAMTEATDRKPVCLSIEHWASIHLFKTWLVCTLALVIALSSGGSLHIPPVLLFSAACGVGLWLSHRLSAPLGDFLHQFQYREKFLLFLAHCGAMMIPWLLGYRGWEFAWGVLISLLCFQGVGRIEFGRIYAVSLILVVPRLLYPPQPSFVLTALWFLFLLMAFRAEHVRFRLDGFGHGEGTTLRDTFMETLLGCVFPWVIGVCAWGIGASWYGDRIRVPVFDSGAMDAGRGNIGPVAPTDLLWDVVMVIALMVALVLSIYWLDKYLRTRRGKRTPLGEDVGEGRETRSASGLKDFPLSLEEPGTDPRGRVLARFHALSTRLTRVGINRGEDETALEYMYRVAGEMHEPSRSMAPIFDRACYSENEISEEDAGVFREMAEVVEHDVIKKADEERRNDEMNTTSWKDGVE